MDELESRMQRVLDAARDGMSPSADDTARTRRLLLAATAGLAVGVGTGTATAATATTAATAAAGTTGAAGAGVAASKGAGLLAAISSLSLGTKVVTAVAVSASIGTAGIWVTRTTTPTPTPGAVTAAAPSPPRVVPAQPPAVAMPTQPAAAEVVPEPAPAPRSAIVAAQPAPITSEKPTPDPLAAELALIERARQALRSDQPNQALAALTEHRTRFEHGVMAQERAALRALALCSLGDPQGTVEAQRFLERNPGSPLATHLRTGCK